MTGVVQLQLLATTPRPLKQHVLKAFGKLHFKLIEILTWQKCFQNLFTRQQATCQSHPRRPLYFILAVNIGIATKQFVNATKAILDNRFKDT